jgi:hypothetical protein
MSNIRMLDIVWQCTISLFLCLTIILFIYLSPEGRKSLSLPDGSISDHPWNGGDTMTYVYPAKTFNETGNFLRNGQPDLHRTIGYPFFLAKMMIFFGENWIKATYFVQIFIFLFLFPSATYIATSLMPNVKRSVIWFIYANLIISGICISYVGQIMTDQFFASFLITGLAFGFMAIRRESLIMMMFHIIIITYAAQVRPILMFFFLADIFFMLHIIKTWKLRLTLKRIFMIFFSAFFFSIAGYLPAARNYINHNLFTQTDVLSNNFSRYLAKSVMISEGRGEEYKSFLLKFKEMDIKNRIDAQNDFAFSVYQQYPLKTASIFSYHTFWNLFEPHWENILHIYNLGFGLNEIYVKNGKMNKRLYLALPFFVYYVAIYTLCMLTLIKLRKNLFLIIGVIFYILPFIVSFISGAGARMRIYVEPIFVILAIDSILFIHSNFLSWFNTALRAVNINKI